jgi:hypothetical protein
MKTPWWIYVVAVVFFAFGVAIFAGSMWAGISEMLDGRFGKNAAFAASWVGIAIAALLFFVAGKAKTNIMLFRIAYAVSGAFLGAFFAAIVAMVICNVESVSMGAFVLLLLIFGGLTAYFTRDMKFVNGGEDEST